MNIKLIPLLLLISITDTVYSQTVYTFNNLIGDSWTVESNWTPSYPGLTIDEGDTINIIGQCIFDLEINNSGTIITNNFLIIDRNGKLINNGIVEVNKEITIFPSAGLDNYGTIINNDFLVNLGSFNNFEGAIFTINNRFVNNSNMNNYGFIQNNMDIYNGGNLVNYKTLVNFANLNIIGSLINNDQIDNNGTISGTGNIEQNSLINNGLNSNYKPGNEVGTLNIVGDLDLNQSVLISQINPEANLNDTLSINGTVDLNNSTLSIEWLNFPTETSYYTIMTFTGRTGEFSSVNIPTVPNLEFSINYNENDITLTSAQIILSVNEHDLVNNVQIWPNPTKKRVNISLNETYENISVNIKNTLGQSVLTKKFENTKELSFDMKGKSGIYLINIDCKNGKSATFKLIKE